MHQVRVFLRERDNCLQEMDKHKQENNILNRTRHFKRLLRNFEEYESKYPIMLFQNNKVIAYYRVMIKLPVL
jgi:hypothetical protein